MHGGSPTKITDEQLREACKTMTRQQIADKYGMHVERVGNRMRRLGIHAIGGIDSGGLTCGEVGALKFKEINAERKIIADTWHYSKAYDELIKRLQPSFEFVSFKHRTCRLRCKRCGEIIERNLSTIRKENVKCGSCYRAEQEAKQKDEAISRLTKVLRNIKEVRTPKTCECCGSIFYSSSPQAKYCVRCKSHGGYRQRAAKYGAEYEHGITLRKVFLRDKGICQICGKPVDWNDNSWNGYIGALYPSVDHIKALANGGSHTWNNVQLAHCLCNSVKGDAL